jgi:UPF0755 protein
MARLLVKDIAGFDGQRFLELAKPQEGYLFPDTYFFYENIRPEQVIEAMRNNFDNQTKKLTLKMTFSGRSLEDVIKMASIVEEEANLSEVRRTIAGILWKRIENNMPLQVDAPFFYLLGKTSAELTKNDLAMNSPYNLYKNKGLPPTPISNPGLETIEDVLNPINTKYWFYLSDSKGDTYYAETHDGHIANKAKYIK